MTIKVVLVNIDDTVNKPQFRHSSESPSPESETTGFRFGRHPGPDPGPNYNKGIL